MQFKNQVKKSVYLLSFLLMGLTIEGSAQTKDKMDTATFGAGCFWCVEAIYQQVKGVLAVSSGYAGGNVKNPSYKEVCTGTTGHAEVTQIFYNHAQVSFTQLLEVFWKVHD